MKLITSLLICLILISITGTSVAADKCTLDSTKRAQARDAFNRMLPVLRHPRCANCHGAMNVFDENTTHPDGPQVDYEEDIFSGEKIAVPKGSDACTMCHDAGNGMWRQRAASNEVQWANLSDEELWKRLQTTLIITDQKTRASQVSTGVLLIKHIKSDHLVALGFEGMRGMSENSYIASFGLPAPAPPPLTKRKFLLATGDWVKALDALNSWPKEDCSIVLKEKTHIADFSGRWNCPGRGWMEVAQTGSKISGTLGGKKVDAFTRREGGSFTGDVKERTLDFTMTYGDNTYTDSQMTLSEDGQSMEGPWQWYGSDKRLKSSGNWSCNR